MDEASETRAVSVTHFVVTDLHSWIAVLQSGYPDIIGRVGWVNDARTAG